MASTASKTATWMIARLRARGMRDDGALPAACMAISFQRRTASPEGTQRSSSASTAGGGAPRRRSGPRCRPRRAGERAIRSLNQFHRVMTDLLRREGPEGGLLREDGLRYNRDILSRRAD